MATDVLKYATVKTELDHLFSGAMFVCFDGEVELYVETLTRWLYALRGIAKRDSAIAYEEYARRTCGG